MFGVFWDFIAEHVAVEGEEKAAMDAALAKVKPANGSIALDPTETHIGIFKDFRVFGKELLKREFALSFHFFCLLSTAVMLCQWA